MNRYLLPLIAFAVLVAFLVAGLRINPRELPSPLIGRAAAEFTLPRLHTPDQTFNVAQMRGQVWLLNVWASWCEGCLTEHPLLVRMAADGTVPIIGLNYKDEHDAAAAWLRRFGNPYTYVAVDGQGDVGIDYGVYGVPETYLIDKQGVIRHKQVGPLTEEVLRQTLLPRIAQWREAT